MALIDCPECAARVSDKADNCPQCGFPIRDNLRPAGQRPQSLGAGYVSPKLYQTNPSSGPAPLQVAKSSGVFILLGLFLGLLGAHNFYAGYYGRGLAQLLTVLIFGWVYIGFFIVAVWVICELFMIDTDGLGHPMR